MKTIDMTKGNPLQVMLRFAVPLFAATALQQCYNMADTALVGHILGSNAVAAVGATSALYSLMIYFASGVSSGCSIIIAQVFGRMKAADDGNSSSQMKDAVTALCVLNGIAALVLTAVSLPLLMKFLRLLGTPQAIIGAAHSYIFIIMAGVTASIAYNAFAGFLRSVGNSAAPLVFLCLSCALNIVLDLLLIPRGGTAGAALATIASQAVSAIVCALYIWRGYRSLLPRRGEWRINKAVMKNMAATALSMGMMLSVFSIGSIVLQSGINSLGTVIIAAHTVARRIYEFLMMPMGTLAAALATFIAQNYGAGDKGRINLAMKQSMCAVAAWSVFCTAAGFAAGGTLARLIAGSGDSAIIENAVLYLRVALLFFIPLGALLLLRNALQASGHKVSPIVSSTVELVMKVAFCALAVPRWGYAGVAATEPATWVLCCALLSAVWMKYHRIGGEKMKKNDCVSAPEGRGNRKAGAVAFGCRKKLLLCTLCLLATVLPCAAETHLLGGLSPDDALDYMKTTKDLVIIEVNQKQWKKKVPFTGAMWIPYDQLERRCGEIPARRPVILHCGLGVVSVPAYETLVKVRPDIPELSYIAGAPPIAEYNEWKKAQGKD